LTALSAAGFGALAMSATKAWGLEAVTNPLAVYPDRDWEKEIAPVIRLPQELDPDSTGFPVFQGSETGPAGGYELESLLKDAANFLRQAETSARRHNSPTLRCNGRQVFSPPGSPCLAR
jgi:hypothetical protein